MAVSIQQREWHQQGVQDSISGSLGTVARSIVGLVYSGIQRVVSTVLS